MLHLRLVEQWMLVFRQVATVPRVVNQMAVMRTELLHGSDLAAADFNNGNIVVAVQMRWRPGLVPVVGVKV